MQGSPSLTAAVRSLQVAVLVPMLGSLRATATGAQHRKCSGPAKPHQLSQHVQAASRGQVPAQTLSSSFASCSPTPNASGAMVLLWCVRSGSNSGRQALLVLASCLPCCQLRLFPVYTCSRPLCFDSVPMGPIFPCLFCKLVFLMPLRPIPGEIILESFGYLAHLFPSQTTAWAGSQAL